MRKIVYCTDSVCYSGGIQRITIAKANALAETEGNEVWIAVTDNQRSMPVLPLSPKVHFVDMKINYYDDDWKSTFHLLRATIVKRYRHRLKLQDLLTNIQPNIVIGTGTSEKFFLPYLKFKSAPKFIREIHSTSDYRIRYARGVFNKTTAIFTNFIDYHFLIKKYDKIVVLTKQDKEMHWASNKNVVVVPNPVTMCHNQRSLLKNKIVITAGRLDTPKNYKTLIRTWKNVHNVHSDWGLEIWGEGHLRNELQEQIKKDGLCDYIKLKGYTSNVIAEFSKASIFVSTSVFEGFPLVLMEAMSVGLPVVSFECPCGPRDIISDGKDGFLVPLGNEKEMSEKINFLIENEEMRRKMGDAAFLTSQKYSINKIIAQWVSLFDNLMEKSN